MYGALISVISFHHKMKPSQRKQIQYIKLSAVAKIKPKMKALVVQSEILFIVLLNKSLL